MVVTATVALLLLAQQQQQDLKLEEIERQVRKFTQVFAAIESEADTLPKVIREMLVTRTSERQGRVIDKDVGASMEQKKQEGYF